MCAVWIILLFCFGMTTSVSYLNENNYELRSKRIAINLCLFIVVLLFGGLWLDNQHSSSTHINPVTHISTTIVYNGFGNSVSEKDELVK